MRVFRKVNLEKRGGTCPAVLRAVREMRDAAENQQAATTASCHPNCRTEFHDIQSDFSAAVAGRFAAAFVDHHCHCPGMRLSGLKKFFLMS